MAERMRVVDSHVHFWDPAVLHYPWIAAEPALNRAFGPRDLDSLTRGDVDGVVFVEANCAASESRGEMTYVEQLVCLEDRIVGIVAFVDMLDDANRTLALDALAERGRVVGVRHNIQGHPRGYCLDPSFVRGVQQAGERGFTFDLCITADQLPDATQLVALCPGTRFILDHCGKPSIRSDALEPWATDLLKLAHCSNVSCKVSGLLTEARADQQSLEALCPYLEHTHRCFGADRLMFGSDWPVLNLAGSTASWRGVVDAFTASWDDDDREAFFAGNAIRAYGLGD